MLASHSRFHSCVKECELRQGNKKSEKIDATKNALKGGFHRFFGHGSQGLHFGSTDWLHVMKALLMLIKSSGAGFSNHDSVCTI